MNAHKLAVAMAVLILAVLISACGGTATPDPVEVQRLVSEAVQATVSAMPTPAPAVTVKVETVVVKETVVVQATVIVEVVAAATPTPVPADTSTPQPPKPTAMAATKQPAKTTQSGELGAVIAEFKAAGLEAEGVYKMAPADYGLAPLVGEDAQRFVIPSVCPDCGGRLFLVTNDEDRARLHAHYDELAKTSALFFSWVFECKDFLLQINGDLPEEKAKQYEAALSRVCER